MTLTRITLRLARNPDYGFPEGDEARGYTLALPLDAANHIDEAGWHAARERCTVESFAPDEDQLRGRLNRRGHNWFFDYDAGETVDDEPLFKLERHSFGIGDYVTIRDDEDRMLTYRVSSAQPLE